MMKAKKVTAATVDNGLKVARLPLDSAIRLLPGKRLGPASAAQVTVDRVDATIRSVAATALGEESLKHDARRRQKAADERSRAQQLRREAEHKTEQAEHRVDARHQQAMRRRERAGDAAAKRRAEAAKKEQRATRSAAETEAKRTAVSRQAEASTAQTIEQDTARERLDALNQEARALQERQVALNTSDEARRLADAAAGIKEERKGREE